MTGAGLNNLHVSQQWGRNYCEPHFINEREHVSCSESTAAKSSERTAGSLGCLAPELSTLQGPRGGRGAARIWKGKPNNVWGHQGATNPQQFSRDTHFCLNCFSSGQLGFSRVLKPTHGLERGSLPVLDKRKGSQASQGRMGLGRGESSKANF